jgi:hypothetical protein
MQPDRVTGPIDESDTGSCRVAWFDLDRGTGRRPSDAAGDVSLARERLEIGIRSDALGVLLAAHDLGGGSVVDEAGRGDRRSVHQHRNGGNDGQRATEAPEDDERARQHVSHPTRQFSCRTARGGVSGQLAVAVKVSCAL